MRVIRLLFVFVVGAGLLLAVTWFFPDLFRGGVVDTGGAAAAAMVRDDGPQRPFISLPRPEYEDEENGLFYTMGYSRGFSTALDYLKQSDDSTLDQHLASNHVDPALRPTNLTSEGPANDWARVGVIAGVLGPSENVNQGSARISNLREAILVRAADPAVELNDPMIRAQLLMAVEYRALEMHDLGYPSEPIETLVQNIPFEVVAAVNQSIEAQWWEKVWSSSIVATLGGALLATFAAMVEKLGSRAVAVVTGTEKDEPAARKG